MKLKLNDLKNLCNQLGLQPTPTKHRLNPDRYELSMDDCIKEIQKYYVAKLKEKELFDSNLDFILKIKSPMLALLIGRQDKKTTFEIWDDNNKDWIFEEKVDGIRCFLSYNHNTNEYHIYSRALDNNTLLPIDYINRLAITTEILPFDFILDTELVFSNDMGHEVIEEILNDPYKKLSQYKPRFIVFDLLKLGTNSLVNQPLRFRRQEAFKLVQYLQQRNFNNISIINEKPESMLKEEYYNYLIQQGKEGIIAKHLDSTYDILGKRSGQWTKIKRRLYEGAGSLATDTYDLFVSDYTVLNNKINGLVLSAYKVDSDNNYLYDSYGNRIPIIVGTLYDLSIDLQNMLTWYQDNKPTINSAFLYKVVEVSSTGFDSATKNLTNLSFVCWRLDRTSESCKINIEDIS